MVVKLLSDPNVVYESAMLLYDIANNASYRDKKEKFERSSVDGSDELMTGLDTFARFCELIADSSISVTISQVEDADGST